MRVFKRLREAAVIVLVGGCGTDVGSEPDFSASTAGTTGAADAGDGVPGEDGAVSTSGSAGEPDDKDPEGSSGDEGGGPPVAYDVLGLPDSEDFDTRLYGTVWTPNGEIPVSGALVYTSPVRPPGIPQHVYCAECEELAPGTHFTTSAPDGTFNLGTVAEDANFLVVTKGQFMRITPLKVDKGETQLEDELTTLPAANDPDNGLYIPLIAVGNGSFDRLEDALGKFGLGDTIIENREERLVPGTQPFDLWDNGLDPASDGFTSMGTLAELVAYPERMARYHIIFLPCSGDGYLSALEDPQNVQNVRQWVAAGGRWYVSDWANEWLIDVFPEYQTLHDNGSGTDLGAYDSVATILDADLLMWLEALPEALRDINPLNDESHPTLFDLPNVTTVDNWSAVVSTPQVIVKNKSGDPVDVGHKVWLEGDGLDLGVHPLTVTGQHGCGKIQFTSYHTAEFFDYVGLSPQELVLIYTILELGNCQAPVPPPQG